MDAEKAARPRPRRKNLLRSQPGCTGRQADLDLSGASTASGAGMAPAATVVADPRRYLVDV